MLIIVFVVFAICWLPLNLFHIVSDFGSTPQNGFTIFLFVHWLAMSSVCYNPFIYSIRNSYFRKRVKTIFGFILCRCQHSQQNTSPSQDISSIHLKYLAHSNAKLHQQLDCDLKEITISGLQEMIESKQ